MNSVFEENISDENNIKPMLTNKPLRMIVNCQPLNPFVNKKACLMPSITNVKECLASGSRYINLDITDYFNQIRVSEKYQNYYGIQTQIGQYHPLTFLMGATNSPATAQALSRK